MSFSHFNINPMGRRKTLFKEKPSGVQRQNEKVVPLTSHNVDLHTKLIWFLTGKHEEKLLQSEIPEPTEGGVC